MKDLAQKIESRFQLLITISIFFPSLIYYVAISAGQGGAQAGVTVLQFGAVVGCALIDYIVFHISSSGISEKWLKRINGVLLLSIGTFVAPILTLAIVASIRATPPTWAQHVIGLSLATFIVLILAVPIVIEFVIVIASIISEKKKVRKKSV